MKGRYSRLFEAWMRERNNRELQPLPDGFFAEMSSYASMLREQTRMQERGSMQSRIAGRERDKAEAMLRELVQLRLRKIVISEIDGVAITSAVLTPDEKSLDVELRNLFSQHSENLKNILLGRLPQDKVKPRSKSGFKVVRFLKALPAIIGIDMKTYGPFNPEDVASIPEENAENLIRRGIAKEVEIPK